jgi:hypothetical protein
MNNEQQELLDDAYNRYRATIIKEFYEDTKELRKWATVEGPGGHTKEMFINKCKTDSEFSEKWGLKIEERELSKDERIDLYCKEYTSGVKGKYEPPFDDFIDSKLTTRNIPTKSITITYKNERIESYE